MLSTVLGMLSMLCAFDVFIFWHRLLESHARTFVAAMCVCGLDVMGVMQARGGIEVLISALQGSCRHYWKHLCRPVSSCRLRLG